MYKILKYIAKSFLFSFAMIAFIEIIFLIPMQLSGFNFWKDAYEEGSLATILYIMFVVPLLFIWVTELELP